jgi:hypothetical protein
VPADVRRAYVEETRADGHDVTINGLLLFAGVRRDENATPDPDARPGHPTAEEIRARSREVYRDVLRATELPKYDAWMVAHALDGRERRELDTAVEKLGTWLAELRKALGSYEYVREGK